MKVGPWITLSLALGTSASSQCIPPKPSFPVEEPHPWVCGIHPEPPPSGSSIFEDPIDAIRFQYPSALVPAVLEFSNRPCTISYLHSGEAIMVAIGVSARDQPSAMSYDDNAVHETKEFNHLKWENYTTPGGVEDCTESQHEQVCIRGFDTSTEHRVSKGLLDAVAQMESTFVFTDISRRLDFEIAALKPGSRFCGLPVKRVVLPEKLDRREKKPTFAINSYGVVKFDGTLALNGSIENNSTMNSPMEPDFDPDTGEASNLPLFPGQAIQYGIEFRNASFYDRELRRLTSSPNPDLDEFEREEVTVTVVIKNLSVAYRPLGCCSTIQADLISMSRTSH
jgi:hypothetical protein